MKFGVISPQDWGLPVAPATSTDPVPGLGVSPADLEHRIRQCVYEWFPRQFDDNAGAFYGFYSAPEQRFEPPQTVNLIAPWALLAAYDRYLDATLLTMARRATDWFYRHFVVTHPMSVVIGGVRERLPDAVEPGPVAADRRRDLSGSSPPERRVFDPIGALWLCAAL
jgi:hypothetical protein